MNDPRRRLQDHLDDAYAENEKLRQALWQIKEELESVAPDFDRISFILESALKN